MKAVVLFEGAGGSTEGLRRAGYETVGFEHWPPAVECARANGLHAILHDLSDPAGDDLVPYAPLWWASPPCQPFSAVGQGEGEFDARDGFPWLLRLVAKRLPDVLITENVKGLTFAKHSAYFAGVLESLRALGYDVQWKVLNAADVGVPQTRERTIIVARRDGGPTVWPMPTHCETGGLFTRRWVSMAEALGWGEGDFLNPGRTETQPNRRLYASDEPAPTVAFGNDAGNWRRVMLDYRPPGRDGQPIYCDVTDRPSPAVTTQSGSQWVLNGAPTIRLTIPELAALQGFPPNWKWTGNKTQNARMVGNACPPALVQALVTANRPMEESCRRAIAS